MQVFPSIKEAFKNGSGDVCFQNESGFLFVSRHSVNFKEMEAKGFAFVSHSEVLKIDAEQNPKEQAPAPVVLSSKPAPVFVNYPDMEVQWFYEEFPDAYNQNL